MESFQFIFFDILTIHNNEISYVKHVLDLFFCVCFHPSWVFFLAAEGGGELGHNLLMQFSSLGSSKMQISETDFFLIF